MIYLSEHRSFYIWQRCPHAETSIAEAEKRGNVLLRTQEYGDAFIVLAVGPPSGANRDCRWCCVLGADQVGWMNVPNEVTASALAI